MCRRTKTINAEPFRIPGFDERTVANQSGAQQWSRLDIGIGIRNRKTKPLVGHGKFCVTAVQCIAREPRAIAKILASAAAKFALTASPAQPRNANPVADFEALGSPALFDNRADDFVPRHQWQFWIWQLAVHHVQIRPADGARGDSSPRPASPPALAWAGQPIAAVAAMLRESSRASSVDSWRLMVHGSNRMRYRFLDYQPSTCNHQLR